MTRKARQKAAATLEEFIDESLGYSSALFKVEISGYEKLNGLIASTQIPEGGREEMEVTGRFGLKIRKPLNHLVRQENKQIALQITETGKLAGWPDIRKLLFDKILDFARLTLLDEETLKPTDVTFTLRRVWFQMDQADLGVEDVQTPLKYPVNAIYAYVGEYHD